MKQSAVEWLIKTHFGSIENCTPDFRNKIKQAKEMEKQQQGYSEEEVKDYIKDWTIMEKGLNINFPPNKFENWFEQVKKK